MIKEITAQSGGAAIKILTDKEKEKEMPETVVSIGGSLNSKISAAAIIACRIAEFKHDAKALLPTHSVQDKPSSDLARRTDSQPGICPLHLPTHTSS